MGKKEIDLSFLPNVAGEAEGLSESGIETFRDKPFAAVARETGQNSRDVRENTTEPVRMTFDILTVKPKDFCSLGTFKEAAEQCLKKADRPNNGKEKAFFKQAVKALNSKEIQVLRISDYNTKGLVGPCKEGTPFHTLAKSDGKSVKSNIDSGGSYGIGKNAVYAVSDIQTAFISTQYKDQITGKDKHLCMGKALFISHTDKDGNEKQRKGYWGVVDGYMPVEDLASIPKWLRRQEQGTSIFAVCVRKAAKDWRYEMAAEILINFFCAIEREEMEFKIGGDLDINKKTLRSFFDNTKIKQAVEELSAGDKFKAAKRLYFCLTDSGSKDIPIEVDGLGTVNLKILLRDGLDYTVGIVRNGMYITNNLANFGEQFARFQLHAHFAALIEPFSEKEGEWFKKLENPRHDALSADLLIDEKERKVAKVIFKKLAKQVREKIRALARTEPSKTIDLDELNDFFASEEEREKDPEGTETDPRVLKPTILKQSQQKSLPPRPLVKGKDDILVPGPGGQVTNKDVPNPEPPAGKNQQPGKIGRRIVLDNERNTIPDRKDLHKRRLFFTVPRGGQIFIAVEASGVNDAEKILITQSSQGKVQDGLVNLICEEGQRVTVDVAFDGSYMGPIEIAAFATDADEEKVK